MPLTSEQVIGYTLPDAGPVLKGIRERRERFVRGAKILGITVVALVVGCAAIYGGSRYLDHNHTEFLKAHGLEDYGNNPANTDSIILNDGSEVIMPDLNNEAY